MTIRQRTLNLRHPARTLALLFLLLILAGGLLLHLPLSSRGEPVSWSTAFFTATSAACVTGLTVVDTATTYSFFGQLVLLALIQLGGLGYMLASTFLILLLRRGPALHDRLLLRDTLGPVNLGDTMQLVWRALVFTFAVELAGAVILASRFATEAGRSLPDAAWRGVFHSVSAFCNAGFDLFGGDAHGLPSLIAYRGDWVVNLVIAVLIMIGGLGFVVCEELRCWRRSSHKPLSLHARIVLAMSAFLVVGGMAIVLVTEWSNPNTLAELPWPEKLLTAFFQSVTLRTAGFATVNFGELRSFTLLVMGLWMFIGASPGGTGGGVKTTTFAAMLATMKATLQGQADAELFNRAVPAEVMDRAVVLVILSFGVVTAGIFVLTLTEPMALREAGMRENIFMSLQFEVLSAFGTVGLSTGVTPHLTEAGRLVIMALMFVGRLGPTTAAALLLVTRKPAKRSLPQGKIALG